MIDWEVTNKMPHVELLRMTTQIACSYVSNNDIPGSQIPDVIQSVFTSLSAQNHDPSKPMQKRKKPAISIRRSIKPDYIVCLEDGKKLKMLKRHLRTTYGLTPEEYRAKWGLPADYPMVAPNYSTQRSAFAKKIGLGRKKTRTKPGRKAKKTK
jgi:predicted transcriptional regulator